MADVEIRVDARQALGLLTRVKGRAGDLRPVLGGPIDKSVSVMFRRQFQTHGAWGGRPWPPLSPATIQGRLRRTKRGVKFKRGRARAGLFAQLQDTLRLRSAYEKGRGPESIRVVLPQALGRGVTVPYAAVHQRGSVAKHIPPRQVIPEPIPARLRETWRRMIAHYITTGKTSGALATGGTFEPGSGA